MTAVGWTLAGMAIWLASLSAPSVPEAIAAALAGLVAATGAALGRRALAGRTQAAGETAGPEPDAAREPGRRVPGQPEAAAGRHTLPWHQLAGLPATVLADTIRVLARAASGHPDGEFRTVELGQASDAEQAAGHRPDGRLAAAAMVLGLTPGTYVTHLDRTTRRATIHALVPPTSLEHALSQVDGTTRRRTGQKR